MTLQLESFILFRSKLSFRTLYDFDLKEAIHVYDFVKMFHYHCKRLTEYHIYSINRPYSRLGVYKIFTFASKCNMFINVQQNSQW